MANIDDPTVALLLKISKYFLSILDQAEDEKIVNERKKKSLEWYWQKVSSGNKKIRPEDVAERTSQYRERIQLGRMYNFKYSPKYAIQLPYYDMFPLCIPMQIVKNGFIGINVHYIYPRQRAFLFDRLSIFEKEDPRKETYFNMTYQMLNASPRYASFKPCLKRYLFSHVRSKFIKIEESEWNVALFLPTEQFVKRNKYYVWEDSAKTIKRSKK